MALRVGLPEIGERTIAVPCAVPLFRLVPPKTAMPAANGEPSEKKVTVPLGAFPLLAEPTVATRIVPLESLPGSCKLVVVVACVMVTEVAVDVLGLKLESPT